MKENSARSVVEIGPLDRIRPKVNFANYLVTTAGQQWGPRTIPDCQFVFLLDGSAQLRMGGRSYSLVAGQGAFYGPGTAHVLRSSDTEPMTFCSVHFNWDDVDISPVYPTDIQACADRDVLRPAIAHWVEVSSRQRMQVPHVFWTHGVEDLILRLVREYRSQLPGYELTLRGMLLELIVGVLRSALPMDMKPEPMRKISQALDAIHAHPDRHWTVDELADLCGYHPHYFSEQFKLATGESPKSFIAEERIRKARMLLTSHRTLDAVASELGYSSVHYFCRQFKALSGVTPAAYRRQQFEL